MNKQIEELARIICGEDAIDPCEDCEETYNGYFAPDQCDPKRMAERAINAGYRLATDVAEEIFAEIEEQLRRLADESKMLRDKEISLGEKTQLNGEWIGVRLALMDIAELKKKWEVEE